MAGVWHATSPASARCRGTSLSAVTQPPPPPGWYPDPAGGRGTRWWDGQGWTDHVQQAAPPPPATPAGVAGMAIGLHVQVLDGQIVLTNKGGSQNFSAGQFGYAANFNQPPIAVPPNPGVQFTPPPAFSAPPLPGGAMGVGKSGGLECTI